MEITQEQYERIADCFPVQRGNVKISNLEALNAILFIVENGCKWRALPEHFGHWHTIYTRMSRWAKNGVLERVFDRHSDKSESSVLASRQPLSTARAFESIPTELGR